MHDGVYNRLKEIAAVPTVVSYSTIAAIVDLDMGRPDHRNELAELLGEIAEHEHQSGRPLLSVVVVHDPLSDGGGLPGRGFFELARSLGVQRNEDDVTFFARELQRVQDYWSSKRSS